MISRTALGWLELLIIVPKSRISHECVKPTCEEGEAEQHAHPLPAVLAIVRGQPQPEGQPEAEEAEEEAAALEEVGEEVDVRAGSGRGDGERQTEVDLLQVVAHGGLPGNKNKKYLCIYEA